jgi:hypothetical protein
MTQVRPLRDVFDALAGEQPTGLGPAGDPAEALAGSGHDDLPDQLVAEAIVSYADTAPVEVAAHLAPFVTAHSAVPLDDRPQTGMDVSDGLALIATAPAAIGGEADLAPTPIDQLADGGPDALMPDAPMPDAPMPDAPMPDATAVEATTLEAAGADADADGASYGAGQSGLIVDSGADRFDLAFGAGDRTGEPVEAVPFDPEAGRADVVLAEPDQSGYQVEPTRPEPEPPEVDVLPMPAPPEAEESDQDDDSGADGGG